ncbi:MAG: hypothetical protein GY810_30120 [Aureispira sp.]|nr:hypothetical protein [Aureispira sp.]
MRQLLKYVYLFICLAIWACSPPQSSTKNTPMLSKNAAVGLWQIPKETRYISRENRSIGPGTYLFEYDGESVTLFLFKEKEWMWKPQDDYYKLQSKWEGDTLHYLPLFGRWTALALFDGTQFYTERLEDELTWYFESIQEDKVEAVDSAVLVKDRPLHDYTIKPMDVPDWQK